MRWAISILELMTKWTADTLTTWLPRVLREVHEQPPEGFAWTSHSLRKGVAIATCNIGTPMQKMEFFGGMARELDVRDWIRILRLRESPRLLGFGLGLEGPDPRITGNRGIRTLESQVIAGSEP
jgi:hypothetical protein